MFFAVYTLLFVTMLLHVRGFVWLYINCEIRIHRITCGRKIVRFATGKIWEEAVIGYLNILSQCSCGRTENNKMNKAGRRCLTRIRTEYLQMQGSRVNSYCCASPLCFSLLGTATTVSRFISCTIYSTHRPMNKWLAARWTKNRELRKLKISFTMSNLNYNSLEWSNQGSCDEQDM